MISKIRNENNKTEKNNLIKFALSPIIKLIEMVIIINETIKRLGYWFLTKYDNTIKEKKW